MSSSGASDSSQPVGSWPICREVCREFYSGVLDLLYPPKCVVCGDLQPRYLCVSCISKITFLEPPLCRKCGMPVDEARCRNPHCHSLAFTRARAVAVYDGVIREAVHKLKYGGQTVVVDELRALLIEFLKSFPDYAGNCSMVLPVPIDPARERERGFNQSTLLAEGVAAHLHLPLVTHALLRKKKARPQVDLSEHERLENVKGAFEVSDVKAVQGRSILLIDDVLTTGSTSSEAAKTLRLAGAEHIYVLTLARSC